jgi:hypothetical protein
MTQVKSLTLWGMRRWSHFSFLSIFILLFVLLPRGFRFKGGVLPPSPRRRPDGNPGMSPCLCTYNHLLWAWLASRLIASSGKVTPVGHCEHTRDPAQEHKHFEKLKLAHVGEIESEQTHPGAIDSFP